MTQQTPASDVQAPLRGRRFTAALIGCEILVVLVTVGLFAAMDEMLFDGGSGLGYYALAGSIIFNIVVAIVLPIWAILKWQRSGRAGRSGSAG